MFSFTPFLLQPYLIPLHGVEFLNIANLRAHFLFPSFVFTYSLFCVNDWRKRAYCLRARGKSFDEHWWMRRCWIDSSPFVEASNNNSAEKKTTGNIEIYWLQFLFYNFKLTIIQIKIFMRCIYSWKFSCITIQMRLDVSFCPLSPPPLYLDIISHFRRQLLFAGFTCFFFLLSLISFWAPKRKRSRRENERRKRRKKSVQFVSEHQMPNLFKIRKQYAENSFGSGRLSSSQSGWAPIDCVICVYDWTPLFQSKNFVWVAFFLAGAAAVIRLALLDCCCFCYSP